MNFFQKLFSKQASGAVPPAPQGSYDLPPLPPEEDFSPVLPNLAPDSASHPFPPFTEGQGMPPQSGNPFQSRDPFLPSGIPPNDQEGVQQPSAAPSFPPAFAQSQQPMQSQLQSLSQSLFKPSAQPPIEGDTHFDEPALPLGSFSHRASEEEKKELPRRAINGSLYVRVSDFQAFIEGDSVIRNSLKEAGNLITRLNELKVEEDKEYESWRTALEDINKRIMQVDAKIFQPG